ncbi:hypothetical protein [Streptomyces sp. 5-10]|uniref:hypothetical protein n=1 Tax=Streptomyces sp. 5-10 TaxID=878925 RepID=UPI00168B9A38|nr:hypothetical protein [Streptomyces sp. 5-10]MBD3004890.1 hypothetical protein [Streptomyces sp. 5-10]
MSEIANRETASGQQDLAQLAEAWPDGQAMSPMVIFDPHRINYCAEFRVALLDHTADPLSAHLAAAKRHLVEAAKEGARKKARGDSIEHAIRNVDELLEAARRNIMWKI